MVLLGEKGVAAVGIGVGGAAAAADDYGDGMQCPDHPYRPNAGAAGGGGVCAFCLQEKLGKLVSSSSSKYSSFSPLPSSLFYDRGDPDDEDDGSSSTTTTPPSAASSRYSSASAANAGAGGGKGKKGSYSLFGGRRRRQGGMEGAGQERRKPGSDAPAAAGKHSSRMMMIPFFHASTRSSGHASKNPQKPSNPPTVPPVYTNRNGIAPSTTTTVPAVSTNGGSGGGGNGLSVFTRSRSVTARPIVPEGVPTPMVVQTSTSSSTTPRLRGDLVAADSPRRRRFWSFLHLSSSQPPRPSTSSHRNPQAATRDGLAGEAAAAPTLPPKHHQTQPSPSPPAPAPALTVTIGGGGSTKPPSVHPDPIPASAGISSTRSPATAAMGAPPPWNEDADQAAAGDTSPSGSQASVASASPFDRKVERSRSVGCGSRSFSGDFLERISTGLGDCALRRVESHREPAGGVVGAGKLGNKIVLHRLSISTAAAAVDDDDDDDEGGCRRRRSARCAGIFGGMIPSSFYSTSSSAAASSYWPPPHDEFGKVPGGGTNSNSNSSRGTPRAKGTWGWAFASPMRAFRTSSATTNVNASGFKQVFHGADGAAARRSTSVAGAVGFGAGGGPPPYPYMNGGC